jgi:hypothetical protein
VATRRNPSALLALCAALLIVLAVGCGSDDDGGEGGGSAADREEVAQVANDLSVALVDADGATACGLMNVEGQRAMAGFINADAAEAPAEKVAKDCVTVVNGSELTEKDFDFNFSADGVTIDDDGEGAEADCDPKGAFRLAREGEEWKVSFPFCEE